MAHAHLLKKTAQRGMSMVQLAIVIAVGGIFAVAAIAYGIRYVERAKVANELTLIGDLKAKTVSYGARVGLFVAANASASVLVAQEFFPASMVGGTAAAPTLTNQWGGSVLVVPDQQYIAFFFSNLPRSACVELGTSLDQLAVAVTINSTQTKPFAGSTDPAAVATACTASNTNMLALELSR